MIDSYKRKRIGLWTATALVVGNMIGCGVYLLPATLAKLGGISILGWGISAVGALLLAFVFADLSKMVPKVGGPYAYTHAAFGDYLGFQVAWCYWIAVWIGNAAITASVLAYMGHFSTTITENSVLSFVVGSSLIWLFTFVNLWGVREVGILQMVFTVIKIIPLLLIGCVGIFHFKVDHFMPFNATGGSDISALSTATLMTLWAFIGIESATVPADDVINPKRTIPLATILGTVLVVFLYCSSTIGVFSLIPVTELSQSTAPYAQATQVLMGDQGTWAGKLIALGAIISGLGALNGWILMQGQVGFAAALDGMFPKVFGKLSKRGVPAMSIVIGSVLMTGVFALNSNKNLVDQFEFMTKLATLATLIMYLYCTVARVLIGLRSEEKPLRRRQLVLSSGAFIFIAWAMVGSGYEHIALGSLLFFLSTPVYAWLVWKRKQALE